MFQRAGRHSGMIFFTTFITLIRPEDGGTERRLGFPAQVEGHTLRLPIGTDVQVGDYVEHCSTNVQPHIMAVIDVIHPYMFDASVVQDHIEVTCVPKNRLTVPECPKPALHPAMAAAHALVAEGRISEAISEAMRLIEKRVQSLAASDDHIVADEALEYLAMASLLMRRLDRAESRLS